MVVRGTGRESRQVYRGYEEGETAAGGAGLAVLVTVFAVALLGAPKALAAPGIGRTASVDDGIRMAELADPTYLSGAPACGFGTSIAPVASFSPDNSKFVVVFRQGDTRTNYNRYTMLLWKVNELGSEEPRTVLTMSSSSTRPAIDPETISWAQSGDSLTFLGERPGGHHQIFELDLGTGVVSALTHHQTSIITYSRDAGGTALAYEALPPFESLWNGTTARTGLLVTHQWPQDIISGLKTNSLAGRIGDRVLYVKDRNGTRQIQPLPGSIFYNQNGTESFHELSLSPDGRYLIVVERVPVREIPAAWHQYRDWYVQHSLATLGQLQEPYSWLARYVLVDLRAGASRVLVNAPVVIPRPAIWAPTSDSVIISQTLSPIRNNSSAAEVRAASEGGTLEVTIHTGAIRQLGVRCHLAIAWTHDGVTCDAQPDVIETSFKQLAKHTYFNATPASSRRDACPAAEVMHFQRLNNRWRQLGAEVAPRVDVTLKEGMNSPPELYYRIQGASERLLWRLNPLSSAQHVIKEKLLKWEWSKGRQITAGLYYPLGYVRGRRYPLVIQTHGFDPYRYEYFGPYPTAFAARPLAARGMFVLQIDDIYLPERFGTQGQRISVDRALRIYKSAISYLNRQGLIDAKKVGIIGFSYTCFYVDWALSHDPDLFAAASVTEGPDGGYIDYMTGVHDIDADSLYGGPPFGPHLDGWVKLAPGFNLSRVRTPLLITEQDPSLVLLEWEWFEGLRYLDKPVEMVVLDHDEHLLQKPWDRLASAGRNVDWFDFWLNKSEGRSPDRAAEYSEWDHLRELYECESRERPTCKPTGEAKPHMQGSP